MYQYQFSNKENLKIQNKSKICFERVWWRKNPPKLFSVMSIKGRSGSLGSGKGMGAELAERSFPWEITQKSSAGKVQADLVRTVGKERRSEQRKEGGQELPAPAGSGAGGCFWDKAPARALISLRLLSLVPCPLFPVPCCASRRLWTPRQQRDLIPGCSALLWEREHACPRWEGERVLAVLAVWCCAPKVPILSWFGAAPPVAGLAHPPSCPAFPGIIQRWGAKLHGRRWKLEVSL